MSATKKTANRKSPSKGFNKMMVKAKKAKIWSFLKDKRAVVIPIITFLVPVLFFMLAGSSRAGQTVLGVFDQKALSPKEAKAYIRAYIASEILVGQDFTIDNVKDLGSVYSFAINIPNQGEYISYVSRDGSFIFPSAYQAGEFREKVLSGKISLEEEGGEIGIPKTDRPEVQLFLMSFCPYGNQAEEIMMPVADLLQNRVDIVPRYIVSKSGETYSSLHGQQELNQDVRELCVYKYQPEKFWDFLKQVNEDCTSENADTCWTVSAQKVGINTALISQCQTKEAEELLDNQIALTEEYQVSSSPTLLINGKSYTGSRTAESFKEAICNAFNNSPDECSTVLSDDAEATQGGC